MKCLFPRNDGTDLQAVLVNTAGGITGGDRFDITAVCKAGSTLTMTTQAAERAYMAPKGEIGHLSTHINVHEGARINWLPQETILFQGCHFQRSLTVSLAPGASALIAEPMVFGRLAMGEALTHAHLNDHISITRGGTPLYTDRTTLSGNIAAHLDHPHIAAGARAMVVLIYVANDAAAHLSHIRARLPATGGASVIGDDVLVMRLLAPDGHIMRQNLIPILTRLSGQPLPRCWMI